MKTNTPRRACTGLRSRRVSRLDAACSALRWIVPAGAAGWLCAQPALAQTYDPIASDIQITHTAGIGALGSITNPPFMTVDVPGTLNNSYVAPPGTVASQYPIFTPPMPAGTYQLVNTYTNPTPWSGGYTFPTGGPQSSTAVAAVGEQSGNGGNTSLDIGAGSGITQTNPGGSYPYASQLTIDVENLVYATPNGFTSLVGGFPIISYAFPVGVTLPVGASANFSVDLNYNFYPTTAPTNTFSPATFIGTPVNLGSIDLVQSFTSNAQTRSFTAGNAGEILLNYGTHLTSPGYLVVSGLVTFQSLNDSPTTQATSDGTSSAGLTGNSTPGLNFFLTQDATATTGPSAGHAFVETGETTNLSQSSAWQDVTPASGQTPRSGPPGTLDLAQFSGGAFTTPTTFTLNGPASWVGINVINPGAPITIATGVGNNALTVGELGITISNDDNNTSQDVTLSSQVAAGASQTWNVVSGHTLSINGSSLNLGANTVTLTGGGNVNIAANISGGTGGLTQNGPGFLTLSGSNNYTGGTTLNGGETSISSDANIGGIGSAITFNGGILQVTGTSLNNLISHNVNWSSFSGGFDIVSPSNTFTLNKNIGNAGINGGSFTKLGAGTVVLSGTNTYAGPTNINAGVLQVLGSSTLNPASIININSAQGLLLAGSASTMTLANPMVVNVASGEFLNLANFNGETVTLTGNVTTAPGASYNLGFPGPLSESLLIAGAHTVGANQAAAISEGNIGFLAGGSLTVNPGASPLVLGGTANPLALQLNNQSSITNLGTGGATLSSNGNSDNVALFDQSSLNLGTGMFAVTANSGAQVILDGGNLTTAGFSFPGGGSAGVASIELTGGVLTASASNADFLPFNSGAAFETTSVVINTNGFHEVVNNSQGFYAFGADPVSKNGAGELIFSSQFGGLANGLVFEGISSHTTIGPINVNGGLLEVATASQLGGAHSIQVNAGGAFGLDIVNAGGFAAFLQQVIPMLGAAPSNPQGGLALSPLLASTTYDFTASGRGFDMTNGGHSITFANMSIGATADTPGTAVQMTGSILPGANSGTGLITYQLGGGGTLQLVNVISGPNAPGSGGDGTPLVNAGAATNVLIENGGAVWLSTTNTYTGTTTIQGTNVLTIPAAESPTSTNQFQLEQTTLIVSNLSDGASSIGNSDPTIPANLNINGGVLRYVGGTVSSSRVFMIGQLGATLDFSGSGGVTLSNSGPEAFAPGVSGVIPFTLAGNPSPGVVNLLYGSIMPPAGVTLGLVKSGTSTWDLLGANSFASVSINGGTLVLAGASANSTLGGSLTPVSIASGATLDIYPFGTTSLSSLSGAGTIDNVFPLPTNLTVGTDNAGSTFDGVIQNSTGNISLTKTGTGSFVLTGNNNTFSGGTTINAGGSLTLAGGNGNPGSILVGTGAITDNGSLVINRTDSGVVISNSISGNGNVIYAGPGTVQFAGFNSYTGPTSLAGGTLQIGDANALGNGPLTISAGATLDLNGSTANVNSLSGLGIIDNSVPGGQGILSHFGSGTTVFAGSIRNTSGQVTVVQNGPGVLVLTGNNSYSGATNVNAGTLQVEGPSPTGSGMVAVQSGATLTGTGNVLGGIALFGGTLIPGDNGVGALSTASLNGAPDSSMIFYFAGGGAAPVVNTNSIDAAGGSSFGGGTSVYLYQQGTSFGLQTPGTYTLIQVASGPADTSGLFVANSQPMTSYSFATVPASGGVGENIDVIVNNTAPVYTFDYAATGTTLNQFASPIFGNFSPDLTSLPNWYNLSLGAPQIDGSIPGAGSVAQFDSTYGNLSSSIGFTLAAGQTTTFGGLSVLNPGPAQYVDSLNTTHPLVMTLTGSGGAALAIGARGITVTGTDTVIAVPLTLVAPQTWNVSAVNPVIAGTVTSSQALTISNALSLGGGGANALIVNGNGNITLAGSISDAGAPSGITTSPGYTGTLTLAVANGFTGGSTLGGGTLSISNPVALGPAGSAVNFQGGTLQVTGTAVTDLNAYNVNSSGAGPSATWADFPLNLDVNNINGTFTVNQNLSGTLSLTKTGAGTLILGGTNTYSGGTYINAGILEVPTLASLGTGPVIDGGGILELTANDSPGQNLTNNGNLAMTGNTTIGSISGSGSATVAANVIFYADGFVQQSLVNNGTTTIGCGGSVSSISGAGSLTVGTAAMVGNLVMNVNSGLSQQGSVSVFYGSRIDLTNNALAINYGSPAQEQTAVANVLSLLTAGYTGGRWTGLGLVSSMAAAQPGVFSIGYADGNVDPGTPAGHNQIMIAYTIAGDANLDGTVGFSDLVVLAQQFGFTGNDWAHANFTYDPAGSVGFADLVLLAQNFGDTVAVADVPGNPLSTQVLSPAWQVAAANTPEPTTAALSLAAGAGLLMRRRRSRRRL